MATWIMEDEEPLLELFEAYEEARNQVDEKVPRRGDNQAKWLVSRDIEFRINWFKAHDMLWYLNRSINGNEEGKNL
jgi:hypothetical protein